MHTATRTHEIACGHRVYGHESKCANLHGHNYTFELTLAPLTALDGLGRVLDFSAIKERLCSWLEANWDHRLLLWDEDPLAVQLAQLGERIAPVPFNPTAENMARYFLLDVAPAQLRGTGTRLVRCRVWETGKCSATFEVQR